MASDTAGLRPFTRAQARVSGISLGSLRGPGYRRLFRGVYVAAGARVDLRARAEAALLLHPIGAAAVSHLSAARLLGLPVPDEPDLHLTVAHAQSRRPSDGLVRHAGLESVETRIVGGLRVVTGSSLLRQLAGTLGLVDLVAVGDAMLRLGMVSLAELGEAAADYQGPASSLLRRAASLMRERVESAMETRLRLLIVLAGLPEPVCNLTITDSDGVVVYRLDLAYPDLLLAIEYDGRQHRADLDQWDHDLLRDDWLTRHGWERLPVVARGVFAEPEATLTRICAAIRARGGAVPALDPAWRRYFPGRAAA